MDVNDAYIRGQATAIPVCPSGQAHSQPYFNAQHRPRTNSGRRGADPLTYTHRYPSMRRFAELLALRYLLERTRHAYYRQLGEVYRESGGLSPSFSA